MISKTNGSAMELAEEEVNEMSSTKVHSLMPSPRGANGSSSSTSFVPVIHLEVRLHLASTIPFTYVQKQVLSSFQLPDRNFAFREDGTSLDWAEAPQLMQLVSEIDKISVSEMSSRIETLVFQESDIEVHVYQAAPSDEMDELSAADPEAEDGGGSDVMAATIMELPNAELEGVWNSLVFEGDIKDRLLSYIHTTLLFSDANIDFNVVSWNRLVLLHGPPGTGKTSLCRALAQKLAIRLSHRYTHGKLVEINSHSLFSKWFSESGKLVQRLFSLVTEMVEDEDGFVVILIDEVESLTAARTSSMNGTEPSDALRVVNALLTQLDKLKQRKNVLVMTTSNISASIDNAFIDRADIKQYIGPPPPEAIFWILRSCLKELMRAGLVDSLPIAQPQTMSLQTSSPDSIDASTDLWALANECTGISGRTLRKLPVLAHARYVGVGRRDKKTDCKVWLKAMRSALDDAKSELDSANKGGSLLP